MTAAAASPASNRPLAPGPAIVLGFGAAVALWIVWFIAHLPALGLRERDSVILVLGAWIIPLALLMVRFRRTSIAGGAHAGLVSALAGLPFLGTRLANPAQESGVSTGVVPSAPLLVLGFIALGIAVGVVASLLARPFRDRLAPAAMPGVNAPDPWLARFALVACVATAPLLFVGGLVTSTDSGMAVPDWPNTFGSNMFLYPLGPRSDPARYLEHSHRLFGTLVGLTTLILMVWTMLRDDRRSARVLAAVAFAVVCVQGVLGGLRVTHNSVPMAMVHGILAQLVFGTLVALGVILSPRFIAAPRQAREVAASIGQTRRVRIFCTALLHTLILQLVLGAAYRHFRSSHILYTHIALSLAVVVLALMAAISCGTIAPATGPLRRTFARLAGWLMAVVIIQFFLGWGAFLFGGPARDPNTFLQALIRTVHQANGGLVLALATAAFVWSRRLHSLAAPRPVADLPADTVLRGNVIDPVPAAGH